MKKLAVFVWLITCAVGGRSLGQIAAAPAGSPAPVKKAEKPAKAKDKQKEDKSSAANLFGSRAVGRADKATYTAATGDVELRGTPRVQEGANMHVATSPDTVMIINQNSQLSTHGPSRTEIRQQPNDEKKDKTSPFQTSPSQVSPGQTAPPAALPKP